MKVELCLQVCTSRSPVKTNRLVIESSRIFSGWPETFRHGSRRSIHRRSCWMWRDCKGCGGIRERSDVLCSGWPPNGESDAGWHWRRHESPRCYWSTAVLMRLRWSSLGLKARPLPRCPWTYSSGSRISVRKDARQRLSRRVMHVARFRFVHGSAVRQQ